MSFFQYFFLITCYTAVALKNKQDFLRGSEKGRETEKKQVMTHGLKGVFSFPQVVLALGLQHHGPVVDGTEVGATAGGSKVKP